MKPKFLIVLTSIYLFQCSPPKEKLKKSTNTNSVFILKSWSNAKDLNYIKRSDFLPGENLPLNLISTEDWNNKYRISLKPFGDTEWIEYLEFIDGNDLVKVTLKNGPLSKIKPIGDLVKFSKKIPLLLKEAKGYDFSKTKISDIYLLRNAKK